MPRRCIFALNVLHAVSRFLGFAMTDTTGFSFWCLVCKRPYHQVQTMARIQSGYFEYKCFECFGDDIVVDRGSWNNGVSQPGGDNEPHQYPFKEGELWTGPDLGTADTSATNVISARKNAFTM